MFGIFYFDAESGETVLCECESGVYYESAFEALADAEKYVESVNAAWTLDAEKYGWKGTAPYRAQAIPANIILKGI